MHTLKSFFIVIIEIIVFSMCNFTGIFEFNKINGVFSNLTNK